MPTLTQTPEHIHNHTENQKDIYKKTFYDRSHKAPMLQ